MKKIEIKKSDLRRVIKEMINEETSKSPIYLWVFWCYNYPPDFIREVWKDNNHLIDHLTTKFNSLYKQYGSRAVMNKFYVELGAKNRKILESWVLANFKG